MPNITTNHAITYTNNNNNNNNNKVTKCRRKRSKLKALLLQHCTFRRFHVTNVQNTRDQITSDGGSKQA